MNRPLFLALLSFAVAPVADAAAQSSGISLVGMTDGYVEVPYSPAVVPQTGLTIEAWVTYDDATLGPSWRFPTVVRQNRNAGQESYFLRVEAGNTGNTRIRWLVNANSIINVNWDFNPGQLTTWTHLAGTWDGATSRLFVNGVEVGSASGSGSLRDQGDVLRIGKGSDVATPIEVWNGDLDEVRLWPFARTAVEIQSTMNYALSSVPGGVSTWNFDGDAMDSSGGRHATIGGSVNFTTSVPALQLQPFPGIAIGASTPGCGGPISATVTGMPQLGNPGFALIASPGVPGAASICAIATASAGVAFPLLGVDVWVDIGSLQGGFPCIADAAGNLRLPLPITGAATAGIPVVGQFFSIDACGPLGLTSSDAIGFTILP